MSINDYIHDVKQRNKRLFQNPAAKITLSPSELERLLRDAFTKGLGAMPEPHKRSLFEKIFG